MLRETHVVYPAITEVDHWVDLGVLTRAPPQGGSIHPLAGAGVSATWRLTPPELRVGPWLGLDTSFDRVGVEAGPVLLGGRNATTDWTALLVRAGLGYSTDGRPYFVGIASIGLRSVPARERWDEVMRACEEVPQTPTNLAFAGAARIFFSSRIHLLEGATYELGAGIELSLPGLTKDWPWP